MGGRKSVCGRTSHCKLTFGYKAVSLYSINTLLQKKVSVYLGL